MVIGFFTPNHLILTEFKKKVLFPFFDIPRTICVLFSSVNIQTTMYGTQKFFRVLVV